jgi:hypothetical protein
MRKTILLILPSFLLLISNAQQTKKNKEAIQNLYAAFNARDFKLFILISTILC